ncbi:MAG: WG repeat-containing protein [Bacteroidales bacterium]|nr:WG repeat-containing protein [Bacteroidales bacterium]
MENDTDFQVDDLSTTKEPASNQQINNPKQTKKSKRWIKLIIGLIVAAILALAAIFFLNSLKSNDYEKVDMELIPVFKNEKWGYVDQKGTYVINPQFERATYFSEGLALVSNNKGDIGYINKKGEFVINAKYKRGTNFKEGLAFVVAEGEAPTCINKKGEVIFTLTQAEGVMEFKEGLAAFYTHDEDGEKLFGFVDSKGRIAINPQFKDVSFFCDGLAMVKNSEDECGFINKKGNYVINPQFERASYFIEERAIVLIGDEYGFIDTKGKYVINPQFDKALAFYNGYSAVLQGDQWGFIDKDGRYAINPQFDFAYGFLYDEPYALVLSNNKWGFIDKKGKYVINPQFDFASWFVDGIAIAESGNKYGLINKKGEYIVNPQFDGIPLPAYNFQYVESDYYDCAEFFSMFLEQFDATHVDGLQQGACLKNIKLPKSTNVDDFLPYSIYLKKNLKLSQDITLKRIEYAFSDRTYQYSDSWWSYERIMNKDAAIASILYEFDLRNNATNKAEVIAHKLVEKLKNIYNGRIWEQENVTLISSDNFYFVVAYAYGGIELYVALDKSLFKSLEKNFSGKDETTSPEEEEEIDEDDIVKEIE